jgi:hypothetical protein
MVNVTNVRRLVFVIVQGVGLSSNAKEPDVGAEFILFFKEALCVHQALSLVPLEKYLSFSFVLYTPY